MLQIGFAMIFSKTPAGLRVDRLASGHWALTIGFVTIYFVFQRVSDLARKARGGE